MKKQKSWGGSTKSASFYNQSTPFKNESFLQNKQIENKQIGFLRLKNKELQQSNLRLAQYILKLEKQKEDLIKLNSRYVQTLNRQFKNRHINFDKEIKIGKKNSGNRCNHCNKEILIEFEKDYRNLVKHVAALEQQILSKNKDINHYQSMRKELRQTKHDSIGQLISELTETTHRMIELKKENNYVQFENEKLKRQVQKTNKSNHNEKNQLNQIQLENQNFKSLINTVQNQYIDKENKYKARIYELEVTIERIQKETRGLQQQVRHYKLCSEQMKFKNEDGALDKQSQSRMMIRSKSGVSKNNPHIYRASRRD